MAIHDNPTDLAIESISECLDAAKLLIDHRKPDGGMMGYAALLLLFSVTDAIGHHLLKTGDGETWFDVLNRPEFGLSLSRAKLDNLKRWYRHPLAHAASIAPGVTISSKDEGDPFDFEGSPVTVRVVVFYELVKRVWDGLDKTALDPVRHTAAKTGYREPRGQIFHLAPGGISVGTSMSASSGTPFPYTHAVSGVVFPHPYHRRDIKKE
jgi:hypothetical protein